MKRLSIVLYVFGLPVDLLAALFAVALAPFQKEGLGLRIERRPTDCGLWALSLDVDGLKSSRRALTLAPHVIFYRSGCHFRRGWSVLQEREHGRSQTLEVIGALGFVVALIGLALGASWWAALVMWAPSPWLYMLVGPSVRWLRGEDASPTQHEQAAYALSAEVGKR